MALLIVGLLAALLLFADVGKTLDALRGFDLALFPVALALTLGNYALRFCRWHYFLKRLSIPVPPARSLSIFLAGQAMTVTPAKAGEVLKCFLLRRSFAVPVRRTAPIVVVERLTDLVGIVLLAAVAAVGGVTTSWPIIVATFGVILAMPLFVRSPLLDRFGVLAETRSTTVELMRPGLLAGASLLAAGSWFLECLAAYVCIRGLHLDVSLLETIAVFTIGTLAGALSFLPGGLGVAETGMTGLLRLLSGVSVASAAAATLLIRLATLWWGVFVGMIALAVEQHVHSRRLRESRDRSSSLAGPPAVTFSMEE